MSLLSPRLQLKVAQKQILTPRLMQMVAVLQLNRLELKDLIQQELAENPVLEEASEEGGEEISPEELQALLEAEDERVEPSDKAVLEATDTPEEAPEELLAEEGELSAESALEERPAEPPKPDPFEEIDFGSFFEEYLDPGYRAPASEATERPSLENFLSQPVTLADHLRAQLSMMPLEEAVHDAADSIIGNLDENGYLTASLEEIAASGGHQLAHVEEALRVVQSLDPAGVGARDLRECLLLQLKSRNAEGGVAWQIVAGHLHLLEKKQVKELARVLRRPLEHIEIALRVIRSLDPRPGLRYSGPGARQVEPDVFITKEGDDYVIELNDDDVPQLRLSSQYRRLLDRAQEPDRQVRNYIKERFASALQLIKNIEQRKQTILRVCEAIVRRQRDFLDRGLDHLRPMMIKDVAEEIGVHASTVSRAVANKYVHTPHGVFELRYFFSEPVQGPSGAAIPLITLKRMVKKMIEEEDPANPLTDEQIAAMLKAKGIYVTRRTVAKYREDMKIPSTHHRRRRD
ncbi:MAG: RNA polymerase factor sigma-54 [Bryobacterales bacterium]|nr:RNA polymerase factor sigma-54 [Bryobacteraceae bacterium]MDW8130070.1 RNA polymerase factor sigma-54 [Bryobacterales bacterium]